GLRAEDRMVALLIRIPCFARIDLSGKLFSLHEFLGKARSILFRVQLGDPDLRRLRNYHDRMVRIESARSDYWHTPDHQDLALGRNFSDSQDTRRGSIFLVRVAGYLYECTWVETTGPYEERDCTV